MQLCWRRLQDTADTLGAHLPDMPNAARARGLPRMAHQNHGKWPYRLYHLCRTILR
jgi:hypothetical protein